jgi:MFS transporter, PPP family, 3-phenylpropionic acid transporter
MPPSTGPSQINPSGQALRLYYFVSFAALGAYLPLFPRWLEARGVRGLATGAIQAALPAMGLVAPPVFGLLADLLGDRVWLLRFACAGAFIVFALLALSASLGVALGFFGLFFAVLAFALFRSPMVQMADVVALELSTGAGTTYGGLRLWGSLGFALMAIVAGAWIDTARPAALPTVIAGALLFAFATSFALPARALSRRGQLPLAGRASLLREADPAAKRARRALRGRVRDLLRSADFRLFLAASFLAQGAHSAYDICFTLHLRDIGFPDALVGVAWAAGVFAEIVLMAFSGRVLSLARPPVLIAVAFAGSALRWALLATVRASPALLAIQPLHAVSFATGWVGSLAYTKGRAPPEILATAQGLFSASASAGSVIGMLAWGTLYARGQGSLTFAVASAIALLAFVLAVRFAWSERQNSVASRASGETVFSASLGEPE